MKKLDCTAKSWAFEILMNLYSEEKRFKDFLNEGMPRRTLNTRLDELVEEGYIEKESSEGNGVVNNTLYRITEKGKTCFGEKAVEWFPKYAEAIYLASPEKMKEILASYGLKVSEE